MSLRPDRATFRVMTWNMHAAIASSAAWSYLLDLDPDIALLQEVNAVSPAVADRYSGIGQRASWRNGEPQRFSTYLLVRGGDFVSDPLRGFGWLDAELHRFAGNLISARLRLGAIELRVVSVYSPPWEISQDRLDGVDTTSVKLTQNPDVYVADLLWATLPRDPADAWIVGGDFNLSETFDAWPGGPRGNREYLDRMSHSGYTECLRSTTHRLTPTFRNPRGGSVLHQIDHLFVSAPLKERLITCDVGSSKDVFDGGLSDHLPIIADFA